IADDPSGTVIGPDHLHVGLTWNAAGITADYWGEGVRGTTRRHGHRREEAEHAKSLATIVGERGGMNIARLHPAREVGRRRPDGLGQVTANLDFEATEDSGGSDRDLHFQVEPVEGRRGSPGGTYAQAVTGSRGVRRLDSTA